MQPVLTFGEMKLRAAELGQQSSVPDLLGEMILQNNLKFELGERMKFLRHMEEKPLYIHTDSRMDIPGNCQKKRSEQQSWRMTG